MSRLWFVIALAACNSDPIDRDIENEVTIENGVYGQISVAADHFGTTAATLPDIRVTNYAGSPPTVDQTTMSDDRGFFQLETGAGMFALCTNNSTPAQGTSNPGPCTVLVVPDSGNVRRDWVQNINGGNWCAGACSQSDNELPSP